MFFEKLENRRFQSSTISVHVDDAGMLHVLGSNNSDVINVFENNGSVSVFSDTEFLGNFEGVSGVRIDAKAGDDIITYNGNSLGAAIEGKDGNDSIVVSDTGSGSSTVDGGNGNDAITVLYGNYTHMLGGNGDDNLTGAIFGGDVAIEGGNGNDTIILAGANSTADGGKGTDTAFLIGPTAGTVKFESIVQV